MPEPSYSTNILAFFNRKQTKVQQPKVSTHVIRRLSQLICQKTEENVYKFTKLRMITGDQNFISRNDLVEIEDKAKQETEKALQEKLEKFDQVNKDRKDNEI